MKKIFLTVAFVAGLATTTFAQTEVKDSVNAPCNKPAQCDSIGCKKDAPKPPMASEVKPAGCCANAANNAEATASTEKAIKEDSSESAKAEN